MLVAVGRQWYRVCFARRLKNNDLGFCDGDMKLIVLSRNQSLKEMRATFEHELDHAFDYEYRLRLAHSKIKKMEYQKRDIQMSFKVRA